MSETDIVAQPQDTGRVRLLGVFAHPDDETFCAGGTLAKYTAQGAEAMVVSCTKGQGGQIRDAYVATRRTLGEVREKELRRACSCLGVQSSLCLDHMDGTLRDVSPDQLTSEVVRLIRSFHPNIVITFDPGGGYGHPDHIAVSGATTRAFFMAGSSTAFRGQLASGLAPHQPDTLYHSLFIRQDMLMLEELAQWLLTLGPRYRGSDDFVQAMSFFAKESTTLQYANDEVHVNWYPRGSNIVEQGEVGDSLYLILSGHADVVQELPDGTQQHLARKEPGEFFGEMALVGEQLRMANVIAADSVTCLVLSRAKTVNYAGRGAGAALKGERISDSTAEEDARAAGATTCIDVSAYVQQKITAIAAHRTQYPIVPEMFPDSMLRRMMGKEYFARVFPRPQLEDEFQVPTKRSSVRGPALKS